MPSRLQELSVYVVAKLRHVYRLQLAKLVYLVDWHAYEMFATPISDAKWFRIQMGPCPRHFDSVLDQCNGFELLITKSPDSYLHELGSNPRFSPSFSTDERHIIDLVLELHGRKSGKQLLPIVYNTPPMQKILAEEAETGYTRTMKIDFTEFSPLDPLAKYRLLATGLLDTTVGSPRQQSESDLTIYHESSPHRIRANQEA
jgi:hypothetical protein